LPQKLLFVWNVRKGWLNRYQKLSNLFSCYAIFNIENNTKNFEEAFWLFYSSISFKNNLKLEYFTVYVQEFKSTLGTNKEIY
jgi:hypothetical protein